MEKYFRLAALLDVYGSLLNPRQREILSYHYDEDLSLSEISSLTGITRQGVFDVLSRTEKLLNGYEEKLGLFGRTLKARELLGEIDEQLVSLQDAQAAARMRAVLEELAGLL